MKKIIFLFFLSFISYTYINAQDVRLGYDYFRKGEFKKAASIYEELYHKNNRNKTYFTQLLNCYRELEDYTKAEKLVQDKLNLNAKGYLSVEQGYNCQLQNKKEEAETYYKIALETVEKLPSSAYATGRAFQNNNLLDYALKTYKKAMKLKPKMNFNLYIANIYGEKGDIENMFNSYISMVENKANYINTIQRYVSKFVTDDNQNPNNLLFKNALIKRLQNNPNISWNKLLSWLFMQQKDYHKALIQEQAIYKQNQSNLNEIFNLAKISQEGRYIQTTINAYTFIIENAAILSDVLQAKNELILVETTTAKTNEDLNSIEEKYKQILAEYGTGSVTVKTQINYADFLVFSKNEATKAIAILNQAKKVASSRFLQGEIKIKLADVFVFNNKFNQALITYTQVQTDLRGSEIAQNARLKVAKTSYYKGDFDWAKTQIKVLKTATSKLISNDALKLNLLIGDNIAGDTIRTALKKYAKADLLAFQNKTQQAIDTLTVLLKEHKGHAIEDEALLKQAELFKKLNQFVLAENNYIKITKLKKDGILADDAYYELGELYTKELNDKEKAKEMYQKIIFDYANSIFLVDARKKFRKLRGDIIDE